MVQAIIYTNEDEDEIVKKYSKLWGISKAETHKKIIRRFNELNGDAQ
jgi:hypothetical protein